MVAPEYVLTAAHCINSYFKNNRPGYDIGSFCTDQNNNCGQTNDKVLVAEIITHPNYNGNSLNNDFALARLERRSTIMPVKMDQGNLVNNYPQGEGNKPTISFTSASSFRCFEAFFVKQYYFNHLPFSTLHLVRLSWFVDHW